MNRTRGNPRRRRRARSSGGSTFNIRRVKIGRTGGNFNDHALSFGATARLNFRRIKRTRATYSNRWGNRGKGGEGRNTMYRYKYFVRGASLDRFAGEGDDSFCYVVRCSSKFTGLIFYRPPCVVFRGQLRAFRFFLIRNARGLFVEVCRGGTTNLWTKFYSSPYNRIPTVCLHLLSPANSDNLPSSIKQTALVVSICVALRLLEHATHRIAVQLMNSCPAFSPLPHFP